MHQTHLILAYFGPETVMPVSSILATIVAVVLMFGKSLFRFVAFWIRRATFRGRHGQAPSGPHFGLGRRRRHDTSVARADNRARQLNE
jgi:hypothetical protein